MWQQFQISPIDNMVASLQSYRVLSDCKYKKRKEKKRWKIRKKKKKSVFNFGVDPLHLILRHIVMPSQSHSTGCCRTRSLLLPSRAQSASCGSWCSCPYQRLEEEKCWNQESKPEEESTMGGGMYKGGGPWPPKFWNFLKYIYNYFNIFKI